MPIGLAGFQPQFTESTTTVLSNSQYLPAAAPGSDAFGYALLDLDIVNNYVCGTLLARAVCGLRACSAALGVVGCGWVCSVLVLLVRVQASPQLR